VAEEIVPSVSVDPQIVHDKPIITGTRILLSLIVWYLAAGDTIEVTSRLMS
jgi:uncharacterized protein (DUF433 family)